MVAYRIQVKGKVQGVFFRASTQQEAEKLGVKGWVRNEPDGSVLIEAEGSASAMEAFLAWCHEGPPAARVSRLNKEIIGTQGYQDFEVTH